MSTEYSDRKIREIVTKVNGHSKLAEQAILVLIQRDPQFLQSLVHPYLNGIILHGIERAQKSAGVRDAPLPKRAPSAPKTPPKPVSGNTMDHLMKALAKGFEQEAPSTGKVSQTHIDALKSMIKPKK